PERGHIDTDTKRQNDDDRRRETRCTGKCLELGQPVRERHANSKGRSHASYSKNHAKETATSVCHCFCEAYRFHGGQATHLLEAPMGRSIPAIPIFGNFHAQCFCVTIRVPTCVTITIQRSSHA